MSELTAKELVWFRLANANATFGFYSFKKRFLARYAKRDGWDLQTIEKECRNCDGSGEYRKGEPCRSCDATGIYRTDEHWLQRWDLCGSIYHVPEFCSPPHWQRGDSPKREITGRIQHEPVSATVARRAYWRLLLRFEPMNFYWEIIGVIKGRTNQFKAKWAFRLIRLRNKLDLFPAMPEDEVPF